MRIIKKALSFDDVLLVQAFSDILPRDTILKTKLTRNLYLNIPFVSAAMDTVTESTLAIAMAKNGGIGIIHKNFTPKEQANEVIKVKRFKSGIVIDPITVKPDMKVKDVIELSDKHGVSVFPVVKGKSLVGIITKHDIRFADSQEVTVSSVMTPKNSLITIQNTFSFKKAKELMKNHKLKQILVVNDLFELYGLITIKDILKKSEYPLSNEDEKSRLRVGAAVGIGKDHEERIELLDQSGVDVIIIDTAHGHSKGVLEKILWTKKNFPNLELIAGNIATADAAKTMVKYGIDAVKVGIGPGSICTTRIVSGVGMPQISAIYNVAKELKGTNITCIADGGIRFSGDISKALAAGAHSVMMGNIFAGTKESPGEIFLYKGKKYKIYRGMGSIEAMNKGSADRYFQDNINNNKLVPEGVEARVPYKGSINTIIFQLIGGVRASMGYCGCKTIDELHNKAEFIQITPSGMKESHVHGVEITKDVPNYHID